MLTGTNVPAFSVGDGPVIDGEPQPVFEDRSGDPRRQVALELRQGGLPDLERVRVLLGQEDLGQVLVREVVRAHAVEVVAPGAGDQVQRATDGGVVLHRVRGGDELDLLDRVPADGGLRVALVGRLDVRAVDEVVRLVAPGARGGPLDDAGGQLRGARDQVAGQRQLVDDLLGDRLNVLDLLRVDDRGLGHDGDRLGRAAGLELGVDHEDPADGELDPGQLMGLEPGHLEADRVLADGELRGAISTLGTGRHDRGLDQGRLDPFVIRREWTRPTLSC
jgi:hypothetical protein